MAKEIQLPYDAATGLTTLYSLIRNSVDQVWSTVSSAFVTYVEANRADYDIPLTEDVSGSRQYVADFPSGIAAGVYSVTAYLRAGGSPAGSDSIKGVQPRFEWSGTAVVALPTSAENADKILGRTVTGGADGGRTVSYFLQGGANKIEFAADGLSYTVYSTDDLTPLYTGVSTRHTATVPGLRSIDPN